MGILRIMLPQKQLKHGPPLEGYSFGKDASLPEFLDFLKSSAQSIGLRPGLWGSAWAFLGAQGMTHGLGMTL